MAIIQSDSSSSLLTVDATSTAARATLYDISGNAMCDVASLNNILNALNANVTFTLGGQSTIGFNVAGTSGTLTLTFEATIDNLNWFTINGTPLGGGSPVSSVTGNGQWLADTGGFYAVRARISAFTSGSMTVSLVVSPSPSKNIAQNITTSGTITISGAVNQGTPNTLANAWPVEMTDGTNVLGTSSHPLRMDPTGTTTQPVSGTLTTNPNPIADRTATGTITANGQTVSISTNGIGTVGVFIGTTAWTGTISFEGTINGTDWFSVVGLPVGADTIGVTSTTANGQWRVIGSGLLDVRVHATAAITGTATITLEANATGGLVKSAQGSPNSIANSWPVEVTDGTNILGTSSHPVRTDPTGSTTQPVSISGTVLVSGTVIANQGTANTVSNAWPTLITDGTNTAAVKAASTVAVTTDPSAVVALSPNSPLPNLGNVDSGNSSTVALGASATFTGTGTSGLGYSVIAVSVMAIGASAPPGTLIIEQSSDNTNWDVQDSYSVVGGTASPTGEFDITINLRAKFYRVVYVNGATAQTAFRLQTITIPVFSPQSDAPTQKGIQANTYLPVQEPKDTGRTVRTFVATNTAGIATEAMVTLTPYTGFTAGSTGTSFTVTAGKTLRLQTLTVSVRTATTTGLGAIIRLRISSSGAATTSTGAMVIAGAFSGAATGGVGTATVNFPDGLELSGTQQFGISELASSTSAFVDISLVGYEY